ncbi:MAG: lysophospholipase L1-like esterase [Limisphaerales bacterium]|jgi:lysophospholipase L1-like esterase
MPAETDDLPTPEPKRFGWKTGVAIMLVTSLLVFSVAEYLTRRNLLGEFENTAARFTGSFFVLQPEQDYEYSLQPGLSSATAAPRGHPWNYAINSEGFRGPEFPPKQTGRFRILFLGDSYTFGWGVDQDRIFPIQLLTLLNESATNRVFEGINLAVPGYNTEMELALLRERIDSLKPDLVFLGYVYNDAEPQQAAPMHPARRYQFCTSWFLEQLRSAANSAMGTPLFDSRKFEGTFDVVKSFAAGSWKWPRSKAALIEMSELCGTQNVPLFVSILPGFEAGFEDHTYAPIHRMVGEWCRVAMIKHLDLLPAMKGLDARQLMLEGDGHPNAAGHAIIAGKLLESIRSFGD